MKRYRLAVCKGSDCRRNGADKVFATAKEQIAASDLASRCEVYRGGCYGLCHLGPNVVVREDRGVKRDPFSREDFQLMGWEGEVYYAGMTPEKISQVVQEHIAKDAPIEALRGSPEDTDPTAA
ncbi:MAG: (2Fe-2S) ferredoxin domain-containing protein [Myxococcaceae bacterium]